METLCLLRQFGQRRWETTTSNNKKTELWELISVYDYVAKMIIHYDSNMISILMYVTQFVLESLAIYLFYSISHTLVLMFALFVSYYELYLWISGQMQITSRRVIMCTQMIAIAHV